MAVEATQRGYEAGLAAASTTAENAERALEEAEAASAAAAEQSMRAVAASGQWEARIEALQLEKSELSAKRAAERDDADRAQAALRAELEALKAAVEAGKANLVEAHDTAVAATQRGYEAGMASAKTTTDNAERAIEEAEQAEQAAAEQSMRAVAASGQWEARIAVLQREMSELEKDRDEAQRALSASIADTTLAQAVLKEQRLVMQGVYCCGFLLLPIAS